ncbi:sushi, von Willebrand factor type A, EGF and pentraxin domain-containing protein 1-like [Patiria miniata]|uniref:Sushi, von Willebrand factor type A, EGF and pentraxin domain-containing protein 1 n=1 Tax=Patiria miniata TaxID=46514 RepID=A0A914AUG8_PATMI|nr:sushi, von Willebrand factor type A, EGF and pentraxin domain-containing protein 1-like [Patiria miniata]
MSYLCTESLKLDGRPTVNEMVVVTAAVLRLGGRLRCVTIMLPFLLLWICMPCTHSMSIVQTEQEQFLNETGPSIPDATSVKNIHSSNDKQSPQQLEEPAISDDGNVYDDAAALFETQEFQFGETRKLSHAEAKAGCSNMSSAEVLKGQVDKLRNTANGQVDLVFLVDSSASVGNTNFFNELKFVKKLLASFEVAEWATRVTVITFASRHRVVANIDHLGEPSPTKHKCSLLNAELPGITYVGGGTFTRGAFLLAQKALSSPFARPNATKAVFLITDGYSNGGDPRPIAQNLARNNVEIFTFGIKNGNVKELHMMATVPKRQHCYILDTFQEFEALARRALHEDLRLGEFILESAGLCSSLCPEGGHCCHPLATCRCGTTNGQYECICPQGYYGSGFVNGCHACPAGTYKPRAIPGGISTCKACPDPNHTSGPGSISVKDCTCRSGYQAVSGEPACRMMTCPVLAPPTNGFFVSGECSNTIHSACALRCSPGYELIGRSIVMCSADSSWSSEPATCRVKKCQPLQQISGGTFHCTRDDFAFDTECTTLCSRGHILVGSKMRRCLPIARWDGLPSACRAVTCPPLEPVLHTSLQPASCTSDRQTYGTECVTVCDPGYQLQDESQSARQCLESGMWSPKPDRPNVCLDVTTPDIMCPDDITVDAIPGDSVSNVSWVGPLTVDNSGEVPAVTVTPAVRSPWLFPIGDTFITYYATDKARNSGSCSFVISVIDSQPPVIEQCRSPNVVLATDDHNPQVAWEEPQFSDNSGGPVTVSRSHTPGLSLSFGTTNVEYIARDETGNTKSCHITVNVQQSACVIPEDPQHGRADCTSLGGGVECTLRCDDGYAFPIEPEPVYRCSEDGRWSPSHAMPWEDCSKRENPANATLPVRFTFPVDFCNQNLADEMADNIRRNHENKAGQICSGPVDCRFAGIRVNCLPQGGTRSLSATVADLTSSHGQRQQLRGDINFNREQFEKLQQFPGVLVDMNITGQLSFPEGETSVDEDAYQELRSSLSSASNSLVQSVIVDDSIPSGMGAQLDANSIVVLPSETIPMCPPGNVVGQHQCLRCAAGTFLNGQTRECERCPQGSYQDQFGQIQCIACPPGTSTAKGRAESVQDCKDICNPGSSSNTGLEQCEACPKGSYQPLSGSTDCLPCPSGTSTLKTGSSIVKECAEPCKSGYVSRSGLVPCLPCPDGYFQPGISKTSCYKCPQTTLANSAVSTWEDCIGPNIESFNISSLEVLPYNDCFSDPCANGATCQRVSAGYVCICRPGYTGITCDTEIDDCESTPCENGGSCRDGLNDFSCVCPEGYQGKTCSVDINECQHSSCQHNGTCLDGLASYHCVCPRGYAGDLCEHEVNECLSDPCYHGARCVDGLASFSCDCRPGYHGTFCEMETNECESRPCMNGATCHDLVANYRCECKSGFNGVHCETDIDECVSSPCQFNGTCQDDVNGYQCNCQHGYTGDMCEIELPWDFNLLFEHLSTTDYVMIDRALPDLTEVTVAFWMRSEDTNYGSPFSYGAVDGYGNQLSNAFTFMDYSGFVLYVNDSRHVSDVTANDGVWHHVAVTWSSIDGEWVIYKDGDVVDWGEGLAEGAVIPGGGVFVLGQEQDSIGGDFASSEAFVGELTLLHVWARVLSSREIAGLLRDCHRPDLEGAVLAWPDVLLNIYGEVRQVKNDFCKGCYAPFHPKNGYYTGYQTGSQHNVVYYECESGFEVDSRMYNYSTCQISGDWMPYEPPICRRILCRFPDLIENGEIVGTKSSYESQISYICRDGYTLIGPAVRECLETREWSGYQPRCEVVLCGSVPEIPNSDYFNYEGGSDVSSQAVVYRCRDGYQLQGQGIVTCGPDGEWSQLPECLAIICSQPERSPHSSFTLSRGYVLGDQVTYTCYAGYQLIGNATRTCLPDASWSDTSPKCVPIQCGAPPNITFATYSLTGLTLGSVAQYSCLEGYQMHGTGSLQCVENLKWVGEYLACLPKPCPDIERPSHGDLIGDLFQYGETVTFTCNAGYQLDGPSTTLECLASGFWNDSLPVCEPVLCGLPDKIPNGYYNGEHFEFGGVVEYRCQLGFNLIGQLVRSCDTDGQWNGSAPHCERVTCDSPPTIQNADLVSKDQDVYYYPSNVTFQCRAGYTLQDGRGTLSCGLNGTWQGEQEMCETVTCMRLGGLLNGRLVRTGHNFEDTATYLCHEGFYLVGNLTRVCQAEGQWSGVDSRCLPISCPRLPDVAHAKFTVKARNESFADGSHPYRTKVRYRCDPGYQLDGDQELRCAVSGEWSAALPSCQPIGCHDLPIPSHGAINGDDQTYNKSVTYTCETGYRLLGKPVRTCLADGTWSGDFPICKMVICGEPPRPENGRFTGHNFLYRGVADYWCNQGYILNGTSTTSCLSTGLWSSPPPLCQPIDCGPPPAIVNTTHTVNSTLFGSLAYYACQEGYRLDGSPTLECRWNGEWMGGASIRCTPMICNDPPPMEFGFTKDMDYYVGDTAEYACIEGALLHGNGLVTCLPNRTWSRPTGVCRIITCPELVAPSHGAVFSPLITNGSVAVYTCDEGYVINGTSNLTCTESSTWNHSPPECRPVTCPVPSIQNGTAAFSGHQYLDKVSYNCDRGFRLEGDTEQNCLANATWSGETPLCKLISCGVPDSTENGFVTETEIFYEGEVTYTCRAGYQLQGTPTRSCLSSGILSGETPVCEVITCAALPKIKNAVPSGSNSTYGSLVSYLCLEGFYAEDNITLECLANGSWSRTDSECLPVSCGSPSEIESGDISQNNGTTFGSVVSYHCREGHVMEGTSSVACQANGQWGKVQPVCKPVVCGPPPRVENGDVTSTSQSYLSSAVYACQIGYILIGPDTATCLSNGSWSYGEIRCEPISCDRPEPISHGRWAASSFALGERLSYMCDLGHDLVGRSERTCTVTGDWSGEPPICRPIKCPTPPELTNGVVLSAGNLQYQSKVLYGCDVGYVPSTSELSRTCQADGTWSVSDLACLPISCGPPPHVDNTFVPRPPSLTYNTSIVYHCGSGYQPQGLPVVTCLADGSWSIPQFQCNPINCGNLGEIENGKVGTAKTTFNSLAVYSCDEGYTLHGPGARRCLAQRAWSDTAPTCKPVPCGMPPSIRNAVHINTDISLTVADHVFGAVAQYTCVEGYKMASSDTLVCQSSGTWNTTNMSCEIRHCPPPTAIDNGQAIGDTHTFRSTVHYTCDAGYEITGSANLTCLADETWHPSTPNCTHISCPEIIASPDTTISGNGHRYQDTLAFRCKNDLQLHGARQLRCTADGTWDQPLPTCAPRSCSWPVKIDNGVVFGHRYQPGDTISYRCFSGYLLDGPSSRKCLPDYRWNGRDPKCVRLNLSSALNHSPVCIFPCLHGGTCIAPYQCNCPYGFAGSRCETELCTSRCIGNARCTDRHPGCK